MPRPTRRIAGFTNCQSAGRVHVASCQHMTRVLAILVVVAAAACGGDDGDKPEPPNPSNLLGKLNAIEGWEAVEMPTDVAGFHYYVIHVTQPVDHNDPGGATFRQEVSLIHRDGSAPMVVLTSGYWDYYLDRPVELTGLLGGNQISIEHRFFGESRPEPADWSKLTIQQMAADEHEIIAALRTVYPGTFLTTGGSKGGMTAVYHKRFFPDDVDGTVPYVAPLSFGAPDARYAPFLDTLGPTACRQAIRDAATEMLQNRRAAILTRAMAQTGHVYTRIPIGPAVESSIVSLEWAFWQYYGVDACAQVPPRTASDDALFDFLDSISPVGDNDDASIGLFDAYYFQAYLQLGYPDGGATYLDPFLMYTDADYNGALPEGTPPAYDGGLAMHDVDDFVQQQGDRLLFVYGEWDPWTGGKFELGGASDSLRLVQAQGTHGSRISRLADADRAAALAKLSDWSGVTAKLPSAKPSALEQPIREPHVPPAMLRALRTAR
jgi:hypothetical protein